MVYTMWAPCRGGYINFELIYLIFVKVFFSAVAPRFSWFQRFGPKIDTLRLIYAGMKLETAHSDCQNEHALACAFRPKSHASR